eukprot:Pgem_evm1s18280
MTFGIFYICDTLCSYHRQCRCSLAPFQIIGAIEELEQLHFADHNELKQEFTNHVLDINNNGINGCFQNVMVPSISRILVFTGETRFIFKGGDRIDPSNWEIRLILETSMMMPESLAAELPGQLQETLRNFKTGKN